MTDAKITKECKRWNTESQVQKTPRRNWYISQTNAKTKTFLTQNFQEFWNTIKRPNSRIIQTEGEECQFKSPENIFHKITEENLPTLKKEIPINIKEAYRTPNGRVQKRTSTPCHMIIKILNVRTKREYQKLQEKKVK